MSSNKDTKKLFSDTLFLIVENACVYAAVLNDKTIVCEVRDFGQQ
jgi:hypothetical protein